ncbi:hypothetical protein CIB48_g2869 [Xylaria polymorpha]|nr:hypothetical protein CIB48_g2869 [Xylaria polymorpha]
MKPTYETPSAHKRERFENFRRKKPPIYEPGIAAKPDVQPQLLVVLGLGRVVYDAYARSDETTDRAHGAIKTNDDAAHQALRRHVPFASGLGSITARQVLKGLEEPASVH